MKVEISAEKSFHSQPLDRSALLRFAVWEQRHGNGGEEDE